jgi:ATPase subunit of ABC transporter with duplicated ATPase domains
MAIQGNNASGKTTLMKAVLGDDRVIKSGDWHAPKADDIGYLDQHYATLPADNTKFHF